MFQRSAILALVAACSSSSTMPPGDDDAPCSLACDPPVVAGTSALAADELSGLAASATVPELLWTHADSNNPAMIYALDTTGHDRGALRVTGATNTDWEDIAVAPCPAGTCIYVADTGDNDLARASIALYEIAEPGTAPGGTVDVTAKTYAIAYPDGPHDAEALIVDPRDRRSYLLTKVASGPAVLYELPRDATAMTTAVRHGELAIPTGDPHVTGASIRVDACAVHLLVRTHDHLFDLSGPPDITIPALIDTAPVELPVAAEPQGEAVAIARDGLAVYTISEGAAPPLHVSHCIAGPARQVSPSRSSSASPSTTR